MRRALSLRKIEKPGPHAIMRHYTTGLRSRFGFGDVRRKREGHRLSGPRNAAGFGQ